MDKPIKPNDGDEALEGVVSTESLQNPQKHPISASVTTESKTFSGPIPPPEDLAGYKNINPEFPDRILAMAETQSQHRQQMERAAFEANKEMANRDFDEKKRGQTFGLIIGLAVLASTVILAWMGKELTASIIGASGLAGLVGVFVAGHKSTNDDDDNK